MDNLIPNTEKKIPVENEILKPVNKPGVKETYEPPMATFVPLKVEERLLFCGKYSGNSCGPNGNS